MDLPRIALPDDSQVDLWYTWTDLAGQAHLLERYYAWLAPEECIQANRYRVQRARCEYLLGRALVRAALSCYTGIDPRNWTFRENPYGKPAIQSPEHPALRFNLSHSTGLVVCAVAHGREVGVDVEHIGRRVDYLGLARRFFAPKESAALERLPPEARPEVFFELWTLKEAYAKARGRGLSMGLDRMVFSPLGDGPLQANLAPEPTDPARSWQFARLCMAETYRMGLAVESRGGAALALRVWETVPGVRIGPAQVLEPNEESRWLLRR